MPLLPTIVLTFSSTSPNSTFSVSSLLLLASGHSQNSLDIEVWPPLLAPNCKLPSLPEERWGASLDVQATRPVLCGLSTCWQLTPEGWLGVADTLESRWYHSTAKIPTGLLLVTIHKITVTVSMDLPSKNTSEQ